MTSPADGPDEPPDVHAVSPEDQSSDREQADANNLSAVAAREAAARRAGLADQALHEQLDTMSTLSAQHIIGLTKASQEQTEAVHQQSAVMQAYTDAMALAAEVAEREKLAERAKARRATRRYLITLLVVVLGFGGLYVRQEIANRASTDTRDQIKDCLVSTGECFQDGQRRTGLFLEELERESLLRSACQPNYVSLPLHQRIHAIDHCILRNLHKH